MQSVNFLSKTPEMEALFENGGLADKIRQECPEVERVSHIDPVEFFENYIKKSKPAILTDLTNDLPTSKWNFDFFKQHCGETKVFTNIYLPRTPVKEKLADVIDKIQANNHSSDIKVYVQEWIIQPDHPELAEQIVVPDHFKVDFTKRIFGYTLSTVWMGEKGSKTFLHKDAGTNHIWTQQVVGEKEWFLFHPNANFSYEGKASDIDAFLKDPSTCAFHAVVKPGDILYVPYKWWHRTLAAANSISVNNFFTTEEIFQINLKETIAHPLALGLNADFLKEKHPMMYQVCKMRSEVIAQILKFNPENILNLPEAERFFKKSEVPA